jgi:ribosomal-protein-alanine N-acetyltransferase
MRNLAYRPASAGQERQDLKMRPIETERLLLREFHQSDLKDLAHWEKDAGASYTEQEVQQFLDFCFREYFKWGMGPWGIVLREAAIMVGNCGFCHIDLEHQNAEVNYYVAPRYRGQGLATEALQAILEFGFAELGLNRIVARCDLDNRSSERVMQKTGMTFDRMIHSAASSSDGSLDEKLYAIVRPERGRALDKVN